MEEMRPQDPPTAHPRHPMDHARLRAAQHLSPAMPHPAQQISIGSLQGRTMSAVLPCQETAGKSDEALCIRSLDVSKVQKQADQHDSKTSLASAACVI